MPTKKLSTAAIIALAITGVLLTVTTLAALNASQNLNSTGKVSAVNLAIYSDAACTLPITTIDWGTLSPGSSNPTTIYINNTGTVPETLTMTTSSWTPANANANLTLSWNRENAVLAVGESTVAILTLNVSPNAGSLESFTFIITLTGTQ